MKNRKIDENHAKFVTRNALKVKKKGNFLFYNLKNCIFAYQKVKIFVPLYQHFNVFFYFFKKKICKCRQQNDFFLVL